MISTAEHSNQLPMNRISMRSMSLGDVEHPPSAGNGSRGAPLPLSVPPRAVGINSLSPTNDDVVSTYELSERRVGRRKKSFSIVGAERESDVIPRVSDVPKSNSESSIPITIDSEESMLPSDPSVSPAHISGLFSPPQQSIDFSQSLSPKMSRFGGLDSKLEEDALFEMNLQLSEDFIQQFGVDDPEEDEPFDPNNPNLFPSSPLSSDLSMSSEHPFGEHPSRTLFVRNINSNVDDDELRDIFSQYGTIRSMYTQCKHRGFVMISYYDIRHARNAMKHLQGKIIRRRKIDVHYSIPKDNPSEKDQNQGTLVVFNLDPSVVNEELKDIFGIYGEIKEIRETPNKKHHKFIEFFDIRDAEKAMKNLNKTEIRGKKIKIEPSRPGGIRKSSTSGPHLPTEQAQELAAMGSPPQGTVYQSVGSPPSSPSSPLNGGYSPPPGNVYGSFATFSDYGTPTTLASVPPLNLNYHPNGAPDNSIVTTNDDKPKNLGMRNPNIGAYSNFNNPSSAHRRSSISTSAPPTMTQNQAYQNGRRKSSPFLTGSGPDAAKPSSPYEYNKGSVNNRYRNNHDPKNGNGGYAPTHSRSANSSPTNVPRMWHAPPKSHIDHSSHRDARRASSPAAIPAKMEPASPTYGRRSKTTKHNGRQKKEEDSDQFVLNIARVLRREDPRTTLMIKNIPNKYSQKMLLAAIDEKIKGSYDFLYLPIDFKNKCNVGYAFINFTTPEPIPQFFQEFTGKKWEKFNSEKVCEIAYARIQGKSSLIGHFQNSSLLSEDKKCRPLIFVTDGPKAGDPIPFPVGNNVRRRSLSKERIDEARANVSPREQRKRYNGGDGGFSPPTSPSNGRDYNDSNGLNGNNHNKDRRHVRSTSAGGSSYSAPAPARRLTSSHSPPSNVLQSSAPYPHSAPSPVEDNVNMELDSDFFLVGDS